ncbi:hypothetical protein GCM10010412_088000 [Nonomuraea recticatena]|uniref:Uncharacterized protein n=1 Tax=Nonomuraea recticatena TaxID=46178 RepID=A0ABP6FP42_9ACTN
MTTRQPSLAVRRGSGTGVHAGSVAAAHVGSADGAGEGGGDGAEEGVLAAPVFWVEQAAAASSKARTIRRVECTGRNYGDSPASATKIPAVRPPATSIPIGIWINSIS